MNIKAIFRLVAVSILYISSALAAEEQVPKAMVQHKEVLAGSKREILSSAVGKYPLTSISGSGGGNGMWDTFGSNGEWESNTSGISGGMRETEDVKLDSADKAFLDGLSISVEPDLSVRLNEGNDVLLEIPYVPDGMDYTMALPHNELAIAKLQTLSAKTTVSDKQLYLLVKDGVDYSSMLAGSFLGSDGDILVVSYSIADKNFEFQLIDGGCCGGSTWTFGPRLVH